jgi:hypothetical protein
VVFPSINGLEGKTTIFLSKNHGRTILEITLGIISAQQPNHF